MKIFHRKFLENAPQINNPLVPQEKIKQLLEDGVIEAIKPEVKAEVKPKTKEVPANG